MHSLVLTVHMLAAFTIIVLVLLQQGKGAEMGASLGAGVSQSVFGSQGSSGFLFRCTVIAATIFMLTSLTLGHMATYRHSALQSLMAPATSSPSKDQLVVPLSTQSTSGGSQQKQ